MGRRGRGRGNKAYEGQQPVLLTVVKSAGQTLSCPPNRKSKAQQSGNRFEQPTQGYSRKRFPCVTRAKFGVVQDPVKMGLAVKGTMEDVEGMTMPGWILPTVDTEAAAVDEPAPEDAGLPDEELGAEASELASAMAWLTAEV